MEYMEQVSASNDPNFVAFGAADQDFCIDIMSVREIRGWTPATALPKAPAYIRGVINLRGSVVPILDFAMRLGLATPEPTSRHVVIIVQIAQQTVGLLVDEVSDILSITPESVKPAPDVGTDIDDEFVSGVISLEERMIRLIDLQKIFPVERKGAA